jgi:hypothetical protein
MFKISLGIISHDILGAEEANGKKAKKKAEHLALVPMTYLGSLVTKCKIFCSIIFGISDFSLAHASNPSNISLLLALINKIRIHSQRSWQAADRVLQRALWRRYPPVCSSLSWRFKRRKSARERERNNQMCCDS